MRGKRATFLAAVLCAPAWAADPLSAVEWLEQRPDTRVLSPPDGGPGVPAMPGEPSTVVGDARVPSVDVAPLGASDHSGVGLLPGAVSGLPVSLWAGTSSAELRRLLAALPTQHPLPAAQALTVSLLLAEADPPSTASGTEFLAARLGALIERGAVDPAREMLRLLPEPLPRDLEPVAADLALLQGDTGALCTRIAAQPLLSDDIALRVYCLAQSGQWDAAVITLQAAAGLGDLSAGQYQRLINFLDPGVAEEMPPLPPPATSELTPLDYRLMAAAGDVLPTGALPLPFAQADLGGDAGWKARLDAAERLVRAGAIGEAQLFAAYTEHVPAASGGVWDRAETVQRFEIALRARDPGAVSRELGRVWPVMRARGLAVPFARAHAEALAPLPLHGTGALALDALLLLSPGYERHAARITNTTPTMAFARSVATGAPLPGTNDRSRAIAGAWRGATLPSEVVGAIAHQRLGEAILAALGLLAAGAEGDLRALTQGLAALRAVGLEDAARRAALQVHLDGGTF